ncbi:MAG: biotin--[acetyl-CoA-carboxylase] ligase [Thermoguttaceae bacterium]|jgi:BirA family biotin operon repressor/biotin-[acetyl-CoA-carboxylase] ligase|nr:biotin--[acetyl-CoA-carboxylase] ligase [Thermoguttaceae bacterium]
MTPAPPDPGRLVRETFVRHVEHHAVIGSTNDRAREMAAEAADRRPRLIVADRQTAGRGRGTKRWWTGPGSLAFSLLVDLESFGVERSRQSMVALAAGIAVVETLAPALEGIPLGLHWPNDVYAQGRKLAGILIESAARRLHVVGIGINTNNTLRDAPPELSDAAVTLLDLTAREHDHTEILVGFLTRFERLLSELAHAPKRVGRKANALCLQRGRFLTVAHGGRTASGVCEGIAPDGALLLKTDSGPKRFHSGTLREPPDRGQPLRG